MTTTITIDAHCDPKTTEVLIQIADPFCNQKVVIQDGHSHQCVVYDTRQVTVQEVKKLTPQ